MAMQTLEEGWVIVDWQETAQKKYGNAWRCGQYTRSWTINCPNRKMYKSIWEIN